MNNTSLAAAQLDNGDKVVFFQDSYGQLNQAVFSGGSWTSLAVVNMTQGSTTAPTPMMNTPLSLSGISKELDPSAVGALFFTKKPANSGSSIFSMSR